ncbi:MAG: hypothetical protein IJ153_04590 [Clostridia bacterium]|nr:hypothetical protein [Clostridia bacterium]
MKANTALEYGVLLQMVKKVGVNLMENYQHVREGVETVMGGKIIQLDIVEAFNEGKTEGTDWKEKEDIRIAYNYFMKTNSKEKSLQSVAEMYGKPVGEIIELCEPLRPEKIYSPHES